MSPPARGAWIATRSRCRRPPISASPPARGAWIATHTSGGIRPPWDVASRAGGVDRNQPLIALPHTCSVASRAGGVDRNVYWSGTEFVRDVASRAGGVDRNSGCHRASCSRTTSPPARGAWIATLSHPKTDNPRWVASRAGGVDRNTSDTPRWWVFGVASRAGGVDRNTPVPRTPPALVSCRLVRGAVDRPDAKPAGSPHRPGFPAGAGIDPAGPGSPGRVRWVPAFFPLYRPPPQPLPPGRGGVPGGDSWEKVYHSRRLPCDLVYQNENLRFPGQRLSPDHRIQDRLAFAKSRHREIPPPN